MRLRLQARSVGKNFQAPNSGEEAHGVTMYTPFTTEELMAVQRAVLMVSMEKSTKKREGPAIIFSHREQLSRRRGRGRRETNQSRRESAGASSDGERCKRKRTWEESGTR